MARKCSKTVNGKTYEVPLFPMEVMNISQGCNGSFSHAGAMALDSAGKDTGKDPVFAPVTMRYKTHDVPSNGNAIWFESVNPCLCADGSVNYLTFMFIHDDYIQDVINLAKSGHIFEQGEEVLDEGVAGFCTGAHSHIEVAKGKFVGQYVKNSYGTWQLPNAVSPDSIFVTDGIKLINNGQPASSGNRMNWKTSSQIPGASVATSSTSKSPSICPAGSNYTQDCTVNVGDTVSSISCSITIFDPYSNSIFVPEFDSFISLDYVSESPDSMDGNPNDGYLATTAARVYLDPCKVEAIDTKKNQIKVHGIWIKADPVCGLKK